MVMYIKYIKIVHRIDEGTLFLGPLQDVEARSGSLYQNQSTLRSQSSHTTSRYLTSYILPLITANNVIKLFL